MEINKMAERIVNLGGIVIKPKNEDYIWFDYTFNGIDFGHFTTTSFGGYSLRGRYPQQLGVGIRDGYLEDIKNPDDITDDDLRTAPTIKSPNAKSYESVKNFIALNNWYEYEVIKKKKNKGINDES